jgi:hypothetical protein
MIKATNEFDFIPYSKLPKRRRVPYRRKQPSFRMMIEIGIPLGGEPSTKLWRALELPPGWRKNPRQNLHRVACMPVRFQCDDPSRVLTTEQIETLRGQVALMCI